MPMTFRDRLATLLVAGIAVPYLGYLAFGFMPFVPDARAMAGTGLALGLVACAVGARTGAPLDAAFWGIALLGAGTLAAGVAALLNGDGRRLAWFMAGTGVVWALSTLRHAGMPEPHVLPAPAELVRRW